MQRQNMKVTSADLAVTSFSKSKDSVLCSSSCLLSARSSIQFIAAFRFGDSRMRLSSAATTMSFVLSRLRIEDADHATGSRTYRIAKERPQNDRKRSVAIGRPATTRSSNCLASCRPKRQTPGASRDLRGLSCCSVAQQRTQLEALSLREREGVR